MSPFHLNKESVLGQDDIDSLVSGVSNQGASPAAQANAAPPLVEAVQPAPPVRVMNAEERPAAGTDLAQRIEKLEEAVSKLAQSVGGAKSQTQAGDSDETGRNARGPGARPAATCGAYCRLPSSGDVRVRFMRSKGACRGEGQVHGLWRRGLDGLVAEGLVFRLLSLPPLFFEVNHGKAKFGTWQEAAAEKVAALVA